MKKILIHSRQFLVLGVMLICSLATNAQTLTGTYTLPGTVNGQNIDNLTKLAALLGNASNPVSGNVVFEFGPTYNAGAEVFPITFNAFTGTGSVTLRPANGATLVTSGSNTTGSIVLLNGTQRLTIDGRPGGTGTTIGWTFRNTALAGTQPTFQLTGATNDTLQYLQIEGQNISSTSGTILLSAGGNRYITIRNNNITHYASGNRTPANAIYASGTTANPNSYNSVLDNHISNFTPGLNYQATGVTVTGTGLNTNYGDNWTISGNSIYVNVTENNSYSYTFINFKPGNGSTSNTISGNYIGGDSPLASGTFNTQATGSDAFVGIDIIAGGVSVSDNVIRNIALNRATSGNSAKGILLSNGSTAANTYIVRGNTVSNILNTGQWGIVGIQNTGGGNIIIDGNTVSDLVSTYALNPSSAKVVGIYTDNGANSIINNTVYNITAATSIGSGSIAVDAAATGISMNSSLSVVQTVSNNTVYNIISSQASVTSVRLYGIHFDAITSSAVTHIINGNFVYNIYGNATNPNTSPSGIKIRNGRCNITNNVVALGHRADGSAITAASNLTGIIDSSSGSTNMIVNVWHNSVYIGGTGVTAGNSYAFRRFESNISPSNVEDIRNNIFVNARSNGTGTGKHYGIFLDRTTTVTSDYNLVYGVGTGFVPFNAAGTDYATFFDWRTATSQDINSLPADPLYIAPTATTPDLHIPGTSTANQMGTNIAAVVYDKDSLLRSSYTPTDVGAYVACGSGSAPTVTLAATATTICSSTSVTFTATPSAGASAGNYNFIRNGVSVQNGTSSTYATNSLANNDSVRVIYSTTASCVSTTPASSNTITMTVTPSVTPTVILSVSQNNVCTGTAITFTATASNGGPAPTFNFIRNGVSVQNGPGNTYTSNTFANGDSVRVVLTSNAACVTTSTSTVSGIILVIKPNASTTLNQTICFGDSYLGYNTTGVHRDTFVAANGCDSVRTLNLTVRQQNLTNIVQSICTGNSYLGYTATGVYNDTFVGANGCDSIRVLDLTVDDYQRFTDVVTICAGNNYLGYTATGIYHDTLPPDPGPGCDRILTIDLTVLPLITHTMTQAICDGQNFEGYTASGIYMDTFTVMPGNCDSIRILNLTVLPVSHTSESQTICFGDSYLGYSATGIYRDTVQTGNGCDSIHTLNLTVLPENVVTIAQTICQGQNFEGYTATGTYRDTLAGANSCDSIRILNLNVVAVILTNESQTICGGESYQGHSQAGTYSDTTVSSGGCDSIHTLMLTVADNPVAPAISATNNVLSVPDTFAGYQWYLDGVLLPGEEADTLQAMTNGEYTVVVTNGAGCSDTSAIFNVTGIGITETNTTLDIQFYPNPTSGLLHVQVSGLKQASWTVFNSLGQRLASGFINDGIAVVSMEAFADGVYYIRVEAKEGMAMRKVLLAK